MVSADYIEEVKGRALLSCMKCNTIDAHSIGRMLGFSKNQGKHLRADMHEKIRRVVDAVFDGNADALSAAKDHLFEQIKRVQPQPEEDLPIYRDDDAIRGLVDEIAHNVTRFTRHLQRAQKAVGETEETLPPESVVDSATAVLKERDGSVAAPGYPRIAAGPPLRRNRG